MRWTARLLRSVSSPRPSARQRAHLNVLALEDRAVPSMTLATDPTGETVPAEAGEVKPDPVNEVETATDVPAEGGGVGGVGGVGEIIKGEPRPDDTGAAESGPLLEEDGIVNLRDVVLAATTAAPKPKAPFPQIGDRVWKDLNGNGLQDPGEPGLAGVTLQLFQGGKLVGTTVTDGRGAFAFNCWNVTNGTADTADDGLVAGKVYQIKVTGDQMALTGLRAATANSGGDELRDSDAAGGILEFTMGPDEMYGHYDLGFTAAATIGSVVWGDANNNGIKDGTEAGMPGVTVRLLDVTGTTEVARTTTGTDGSYQFGGLVPGTYMVEIAQANFRTGGALHGSASSNGASGKAAGPYEGAKVPDPNGSKPGVRDHGTTANGAVRCKPITVLGGTLSNRAAAFGFFAPGTVTGKVFVDVNANGRIDLEDKSGVAGVKVTAAGPAGVFTAVTDATGAYSLVNLPAGTYTVTQVQPGGYKTSTPNLVTTAVGPAAAGTVNFGEARMSELAVKLSAPATAVIGNTLTMTFRVKNLGTLDAAGVTLLAQFPRSLKVLSVTATGGTFDQTTMRATIPTLAAGAEAVFTVRVRATQTGPHRLMATVQGAAAEDQVGNNKAIRNLVVTPVAAPARPLAAMLSSAFRR